MIPLRLDFASSVGSVSPSVKPDGTFVAILPEGTYRVTVAAALPRTYEIRSFTYGSANVLTSALVIRPDALEEFVLRLRTSDKPVKVMGRVVGVNGLTKVEGSVRLRRQGFVSVLETTVGAGGAIEFPRVYPGEYTLEPAVPGLVGYRWFVVGDKDITDLELFVGRK
jgi:hypothetical protein